VKPWSSTRRWSGDRVALSVMLMLVVSLSAVEDV
jgi:hypothetical protein